MHSTIFPTRMSNFETSTTVGSAGAAAGCGSFN